MASPTQKKTIRYQKNSKFWKEQKIETVVSQKSHDRFSNLLRYALLEIKY